MKLSCEFKKIMIKTYWFLIIILLFFLLNINILNFTNDILFNNLYLVASIYIILFLFSLFHELGHLIYAFYKKYPLSFIKIFNIYIFKNNNGKFKIKRYKIDHLKNSKIAHYFNSNNLDKIYYSSGLICNFFLVIVSIIIIICFNNIYSSVALISVIIGISFIITNLIPIKSGMLTDGYSIFIKANSQKKLLKKYNTIMKSLLNGYKYSQLDIESLDNVKINDNFITVFLNFCKYYYYIDLKKFEKAYEILKNIKSKRQYLDDYYLEKLISEYLTMLLLFKEEKNLATKAYNKLCFLNNKGVSFKRSLYLYQLVYVNKNLKFKLKRFQSKSLLKANLYMQATIIKYFKEEFNMKSEEKENKIKDFEQSNNIDKEIELLPIENKTINFSKEEKSKVKQKTKNTVSKSNKKMTKKQRQKANVKKSLNKKSNKTKRKCNTQNIKNKTKIKGYKK
ncbi:MAG: hypothetical protein ACK5HL_04470 [Bacilli bacterium]